MEATKVSPYEKLEAKFYELHSEPLERSLHQPVVGTVFLAGNQAFASDRTVTVTDTVATALEYSPRLKLLESNQEAIGFELERAKGYYYPRLMSPSVMG